jgi:hypothetical protein
MSAEDPICRSWFAIGVSLLNTGLLGYVTWFLWRLPPGCR